MYVLKQGPYDDYERYLVLNSGLPNKVLSDMLDRSVKSIIKFKYRNTDNVRKCLAAAERKR